MKRTRMLLLFVTVTLLLSLVLVSAALAQGNDRNFTASLQGRNEVPANDSKAAGQAIVHFSKDGDSLTYKLIAANIEDVFAAHIHCGEVGVNGPVGVTLFGGSTISPNGLFAQATVTEPNAGNACGWTTIEDVRTAILSGGAYVNVHTTAIPGGEIRGQLD